MPRNTLLFWYLVVGIVISTLLSFGVKAFLKFDHDSSRSKAEDLKTVIQKYVRAHNKWPHQTSELISDNGENADLKAVMILTLKDRSNTADSQKYTVAYEDHIFGGQYCATFTVNR